MEYNMLWFIIILGFLSIIVYIYLRSTSKQRILAVRSNINNKYYWVQQLPFPQIAANILAIINIRIHKLKDYLMTNIEKFPAYQKYIQQLNRNISALKLQENSPFSGTTSYTVNKGETMAICLRSKKNGKFHDLNLIMYVVLHELAHIACPETGHTELFKNIFIFFLKISVKLDLYYNVNYQIYPVEYCGLIINENLLNTDKN